MLKQNKKWTQFIDNHNTTKQFDPIIHSITRINGVSLPSFSQVPTDSRVIQTTKNLIDKFSFNLEENSRFHLEISMLIPHM